MGTCSTFTSRSTSVDANGVSTRILEAGEGPPLALLHGTGGHLECYARNVAALAERWRVILLDSVGHGYSAKPDVPYTLPVYSDHLVGVLDALGIARATLSGESLGAWISAWTAAHHPERVDRLILNTPGNVRTVTRDCVLGDTQMRSGDKVAVLYAAATRDPDRCPEPDRFDADRDDVSHVSFGWGIHRCVGSYLAQAELRMLTQALLDKGTLELVGVEMASLLGGHHMGMRRVEISFATEPVAARG